MYQSMARLAAAAKHIGLQAKNIPLLPPIPLYRRLLRAHRKYLPPEMRILGDDYVKAEFRLHQKIDNPAHLVRGLGDGSGGVMTKGCQIDDSWAYIEKIGFLTEWQMYAQKVEGDAWVGDKIEQGKLQKMSDEQIHQLYELMQAIQNRGSNGNVGE